MADTYEESIVSIVGPQPEAELKALLPLMESVILAQKTIIQNAKSIGGAVNIQSVVNDQTKLTDAQKAAAAALKEQADLKKKILTEERELNRLIAEEEKKKKTQQVAEEKELTRLIKIEAKERQKSELDSIRQSNKAKAESDKQYIANYKKLLAEKDAADKKSSAAALANAQKAQKVAVNTADPSSLKAMSAALEQHRNNYARLTAAERENAEIGGVVLARIKELDAAMKSADATQGKYQRNVGNYASAFSGLGFSIRTIAGELPNIGISLRTFVQSLSNNIGPLSQSIAEARAQNKLLAAEGKATVSVGKQVAGAIFNWQTAILALVAAFTYFLPQIETFFSRLFKGKDSMDALKISTEQYSKALQSDEFANAVAQFSELETNVRLAREGIISKKDVMKEYNETIGKTIGLVTEWDDLEVKMVDKKDAYLQMVLLKMAATAAYGEQARKLVEQLVAEAKIVSGNADWKDEVISSVSMGMITPTQSSRMFGIETAKAAKEEGDILEKVAQDLSKRAAQIAKDNNFNIFGNDPDKDKAGKMDADGTGARLAAVKEANELAIAEELRKQNRLAYVSKKIADDEKLSLDERLAAYKEYENAKKAVAFLNNTQEGADLQATLDALTDKEEQYNAGKLKMTAYQLETLHLQKKNANEALEQLNKKGEDAFTAISEQGALDRIDIAADEVEKRAKILKNLQAVGKIGGKTQSREEKDIEEAKIRLQAAQDAVRVEQELLGIISDSNRKKIDAIDAEIAKIKELEDVKRKEILNSGMTEQQQKEAIAALEAKTAADTFALNERKRQQQIKGARFDKAANIALLIQETAIAVVRALGSKPYTPANIALAIGTGAIGAANIARAMATPIPQYFDGTGPGGHPSDGLAIVGDGGRQEVIRRRDGSIELTPARATLAYLSKGDVVHKSVEDFIDKAQYLTMGGMGVTRRVDERGISTKEMERQLKKIANGIDRVAGKEAVNLTYIGRDWDNYIADIHH